MPKYDPLRDHLAALPSGQHRTTLSFARVEELLGEPGSVQVNAAGAVHAAVVPEEPRPLVVALDDSCRSAVAE